MPSGRGRRRRSARASRCGSPRGILGSPGLEVVGIGLAVAPVRRRRCSPGGAEPRIDVRRRLSDVRVHPGHPGHGAARGREPLPGAHDRSCWWRTASRRRSGARRGWWSPGSRRGASQRVTLHGAAPDPGPLPPGPAHRRRLGPVRADPPAARVRRARRAARHARRSRTSLGGPTPPSGRASAPPARGSCSARARSSTRCAATRRATTCGGSTGRRWPAPASS